MKRMPFVLIGCTLMVSMSLAAPALKDRKEDDRARILGHWRQESLSIRGTTATPGVASTFRFSKDGTCGFADHSTGAKESGARYTLNPSRTPRRMEWMNDSGNVEWQCLYELSGDALKVAFVDRGTEPPAKIEPGLNLTIYYLKRVKE